MTLLHQQLMIANLELQWLVIGLLSAIQRRQLRDHCLEMSMQYTDQELSRINQALYDTCSLNIPNPLET